MMLALECTPVFQFSLSFELTSKAANDLLLEQPIKHPIPLFSDRMSSQEEKNVAVFGLFPNRSSGMPMRAAKLSF
ncbi:hypothetical protein B0F90DRAFT_1701608 [Multifurca ochricompacta]|uniref:Uncharacterized protein n=1 Tax=Multifurca ochricompacta TaxID=376703 RepID=A0AAD4M9L8_9AGAM|nr:hypothetical protein B0F90DRAFT_1701608 [Multifurca ochricompacta]